jgi:hypothetical protein
MEKKISTQKLHMPPYYYQFIQIETCGVLHLPYNLNFDMICGKEKNRCVILVKRFIDIPPYLKWDRGAGIP